MAEMERLNVDSRQKGARGEREVVGLLRDLLGPVVRRAWERAQVRGHDLDVPGWAVEVKRYARIGLHRWFDQAAEQAARAALKPVLMHREDRGEWLVTVRLVDWVELAREGIVAYPRAMASPDAEDREPSPRDSHEPSTTCQP